MQTLRSRLRLVFGAALLLHLLSCGGNRSPSGIPSNTGPTSASPTSPVQSPNVTQSPNTVAGSDNIVQILAGHVTVTADFSVNLTGKSSDGADTLMVQDNAGLLQQGGRSIKVAVAHHLSLSGYTLYALLGLDPNGILMGWAYCQGGQLMNLWLEDTEGHAGFTPAVTGTCAETGGSTSVALETAAESFAVTVPASYPTVMGGNDLMLAPGTQGYAQLGGTKYTMTPFTTKNCAACGATPADGWIEVHSVFDDPDSANVCVGILYLPINPTGTVNLNWVNCFSTNEGSQVYTATYTIPSALGETR